MFLSTLYGYFICIIWIVLTVGQSNFHIFIFFVLHFLFLVKFFKSCCLYISFERLFIYLITYFTDLTFCPKMCFSCPKCYIFCYIWRHLLYLLCTKWKVLMHIFLKYFQFLDKLTCWYNNICEIINICSINTFACYGIKKYWIAQHF